MCRPAPAPQGHEFNGFPESRGRRSLQGIWKQSQRGGGLARARCHQGRDICPNRPRGRRPQCFVRRSGRRDLRTDGPVRFRQIHVDPSDQPARRADGGQGHHRWPRHCRSAPLRTHVAAAHRHEHGVPVVRADAAAHGAVKCRIRSRGGRHGPQDSAKSVHSTCSSRSDLRRSRRSCQRNCRAACSSVSASRARWRSILR